MFFGYKLTEIQSNIIHLVNKMKFLILSICLFYFISPTFERGFGLGRIRTNFRHRYNNLSQTQKNGLMAFLGLIGGELAEGLIRFLANALKEGLE